MFLQKFLKFRSPAMQFSEANSGQVIIFTHAPLIFIYLCFPSPSRMCKLIGFSGSRDVFFCREQIQQRDAGNVLWQNSSKSI